MSAVPAPDTCPDAGAVWHYGDPLGEQRAAEHDAVVDRPFPPRRHHADRSRPASLAALDLHAARQRGCPDGACTENLSLDGQGRVEDHWIQTELGGVTYLDTEPWRGEPLLAYLRKMVFWSDVARGGGRSGGAVAAGPSTGRPGVVAALGVDALPAESTAAPLAGGGFVRRMPAAAGQVRLDLLVPREDEGQWLTRLAGRQGCAGRGVGLRGAPGGRSAAPAGRGHRRADDPPRGGLDRPPDGAVHLDKGCYRGQETVARVHNLGRPPRMLVLLHLDGSGERPATGRSAAGRRACRSADWAPSSTTSTSVRSRWRWSRRACPPTRRWPRAASTTVAAGIDPDSMPPEDVTSARAGWRWTGWGAGG